MRPSATDTLLAIYRRLEATYEIDRWHWREDSGWLETCLGAILVQHTAWANVERALARLREAGALSLEAIAALGEAEVGGAGTSPGRGGSRTPFRPTAGSTVATTRPSSSTARTPVGRGPAAGNACSWTSALVVLNK